MISLDDTYIGQDDRLNSERISLHDQIRKFTRFCEFLAFPENPAEFRRLQAAGRAPAAVVEEVRNLLFPFLLLLLFFCEFLAFPENPAEFRRLQAAGRAPAAVV
ncbi:hypothetical protein MA16_Dca023609 [Dendrobium catenatum]|uniref:Uncharacterized protein n=1 Tax=Dendrobium catenatum TaxID=906689 RepID=A0A2I0VQ43_9ASPA|nr:hypothetical protein MA16_Dca023609 [Dendrobium catenatum]